MSADEVFVFVLVIESLAAVVAMAVQSRRAKTSSRAPAVDDVRTTAEPTGDR